MVRREILRRVFPASLLATLAEGNRHETPPRVVRRERECDRAEDNECEWPNCLCHHGE